MTTDDLNLRWPKAASKTTMTNAEFLQLCREVVAHAGGGVTHGSTPNARDA